MEGYSFREVLVSFPKATPIGVKELATDKVMLNPEDDYIIQPGIPPSLAAQLQSYAQLRVRSLGTSSTC